MDPQPRHTFGPHPLLLQPALRSHHWQALPLDALLACLPAGCTVVSWLNPAPEIRVHNRSGRELTQVEVSGQGFRTRLGRLGPGERGQATVTPKGESDVRLRFRADGRAVDTGNVGYIEPRGGYEVDLTVAPDLTVAVDTRLRGY